jgi:integration host factor subunit beta
MSRQTIAKRTIAERIAERQGLGQIQTLQIIQSFLDEIIEELAQGNRLEFRDFGVFETVVRKARTALNPKTLEKVQVGSKVVVKFKVGRLMKEKVEKLLAAEGNIGNVGGVTGGNNGSNVTPETA